MATKRSKPGPKQIDLTKILIKTGAPARQGGGSGGKKRKSGRPVKR